MQLVWDCKMLDSCLSRTEKESCTGFFFSASKQLRESNVAMKEVCKSLKKDKAMHEKGVIANTSPPTNQK